MTDAHGQFRRDRIDAVPLDPEGRVGQRLRDTGEGDGIGVSVQPFQPFFDLQGAVVEVEQGSLPESALFLIPASRRVGEQLVQHLDHALGIAAVIEQTEE